MHALVAISRRRETMEDAAGDAAGNDQAKYASIIGGVKVKSAKRRVLSSAVSAGAGAGPATLSAFEEEMEPLATEEAAALVIPLPGHSAAAVSKVDEGDVASGAPGTGSPPGGEEGLKRRGPLLMEGTAAALMGDMNDDERFSADVSSRPDDITPESSAYKAVPVESFGAALLRGMGWKATAEEEATLRDGSDAAPLMAREPRLGLGATSRPSEKNGGERRTGQEQQRDKDKDKRKNTDGSASASASSAAKLKVGDLVCLQDTRFTDRRAAVQQTESVPGLDQIRVQLEEGGEVVAVGKRQVQRLRAAELQVRPYTGDVPVVTAIVPAAAQGASSESSKSKDKGSKRKRDEREGKEKSKKSAKEEGPPARNWVRTGIQVRIVSKKCAGPEAYLQKAEVVDVNCSGLASVRLLSTGRLVEGIKQRQLETVLPAAGGACIVLFGQHRLATARLLQKDKQQEVAMLELRETLQTVQVSMDDVAALCASHEED